MPGTFPLALVTVAPENRFNYIHSINGIRTIDLKQSATKGSSRSKPAEKQKKKLISRFGMLIELFLGIKITLKLCAVCSVINLTSHCGMYVIQRIHYIRHRKIDTAWIIYS